MDTHTPVNSSEDNTDVFDLDILLLEVVDPAGLVNVTDDGCTSTCGACVSGAV